ncbi:MAG: cell division protein ZapA [Desulfosalsimonadaceae bacterium]
MEQLITIELLGESFQFKVHEEDINPEKIAEYLIREVEQVSQQYPEHVRKTNKLAILVSAALNITKQYFEMQSSHLDFIADVNHRTFRLDDLLSKSI